MGKSKKRNASKANGQRNANVSNNETSALNRFFGGSRHNGYATIPNVKTFSLFFYMYTS